MPIQTENIKLMASQRLTDNEDGGGRMSGIEIVDGNINNLFKDISRLDRVYGRVSMMEGFVWVNTDDTETYSGAHVILSLPAADPNVSVCMFKTGNPYDERSVARDRVESYVTAGPRFFGWLWGDQPAGARSILLFCVKGTQAPDVGGVLCLFNNRGLVNEQKQYVRVTKVESTTAEFSQTSEGSEYGATALSFNRDIMQIEIGDPLRYTFIGSEISKNDSLATSVYTTTVSDAASYYGVMLPTAPITAGDININVNSIYTHLVPSAQGEAPVTDLSIGEAGPVVGSGEAYNFSVAAFSVANGAQVYFGRGIKPGSLSILTSNARTFTDKKDGYLYEGTSQIGTVDYATGAIFFSNLANSQTVNLSLSAIIGAEVRRCPNTAYQPVVLSNRGFNYVGILSPLPIPGSVWVDYMAQGKWYRLRDKNGILVPDIAGTGTGTVNYLTGSITLTCAALPDVDTAIIYNWANPIETVDLSGLVEIETAEISHTLANIPVKPGSLAITWPTGASSTATATDNGSGVLSGDATGTINYSTGELLFKPTLLPVSDGAYTIDYDRYPRVNGSLSSGWTNIGGQHSFVLPSGDVRPGSVSVDVVVSFGQYNHIYRLRDNGSGGLSAPGWSINKSVSHPEWPGTTEMSGISGTVDYINKTVTVNLSSVEGSETWRPFERRETFHVTTSGYPPTPGGLISTWEIYYLPEETSVIAWADGIVGEILYSYALSAAAQETADEILPARPFELSLLRNHVGYTIVPGSISFTWSGVRYIDRLGKLYRNPSPLTGLGAEAGTVDYSTGLASLTVYDGGSNVIAVHSLTGRFGNQLLASATFRTPGAPLRPGSLSLIGVCADGRAISGSSNFDGTISGAMVKGYIDYEKGITFVQFGELVDDDPEYIGEPWYSFDDVVEGQIFKPEPAISDTLTYACVVYSYIPLNADLIGLDPVRLPSDGRVPIVKTGDVIVIHNTQNTQLPALSAGQVLTLPRENIAHVELYDSSEPLPLRVPTTHYSWDKDAQELVMADPLDLSAYTLPIIAMHRIEDMSLVSGAQINGQLTVALGVENDYPVQGTYVSSALLFGDLQARAYGLFDQKTWTGVWSDDRIGDGCNASYNELNYQPRVTNSGAITGRWAFLFDTTEHFSIVEEKLGVIGDGYITQDCAPINPATGTPYFFMDYRGWGTGWAAGNVVRMNTEGAAPPFWVVRTTLQGPVTEPNDQFTIQIRGDAE